MAALGRLDDLEEFLLGLSPQDAFRPRAMWQFPGGLHDYTLPTTVAERIGSPEDLGYALADAEVELVVYATDVSDYPHGDEARDFELEYSSHTSPPEVMGAAILASAADQRPRAPEHARRQGCDGRRLGAELPLRARVSQPGGRCDRSVQICGELSAHERCLPRADTRAARAVPRSAARSRAPRGSAVGAGADDARRARALRRADRAPHARRVRAQCRRRGADRSRARHLRGGAAAAS